MIFANELYHHGIKGQQWGVRRFQYQDGSLTPAGAKRYNGPAANVASPRKKHATGTVSDISKGSPAGTNPVGMAGGGGGGGSDEEDEEEKKKLEELKKRFPDADEATLRKIMAAEAYQKENAGSYRDPMQAEQGLYNHDESIAEAYYNTKNASGKTASEQVVDSMYFNHDKDTRKERSEVLQKGPITSYEQARELQDTTAPKANYVDPRGRGQRMAKIEESRQAYAKEQASRVEAENRVKRARSKLYENTNIENVKAQAQQQYNKQQADKAKTPSYKVSRTMQSVGNAVDKMTGARDRKDIEAHARTVNASVRDGSRAVLDAGKAANDYATSGGSRKAENRYNTSVKAFNNADSTYAKSTEKMYNSAQRYSKSPEYQVKRAGEAAKNLVKNVKNSIGGSSHATSVKPTVADYSGTLTTGSSSPSNVSNNTVSTGETSIQDWLKRRIP